MSSDLHGRQFVEKSRSPWHERYFSTATATDREAKAEAEAAKAVTSAGPLLHFVGGGRRVVGWHVAVMTRRTTHQEEPVSWTRDREWGNCWHSAIKDALSSTPRLGDGGGGGRVTDGGQQQKGGGRGLANHKFQS